MLKRLQQLAEAQEKKREAASKFRSRASPPQPNVIKKAPAAPLASPKASPASQTTQSTVEPLFGRANVPVFKDEDTMPSTVSSGLARLVDLYLHAARHKTRHVVLAWPSSPTSLALVHALATLERWKDGDKQGVRGILYPTKSNAFHPLNHLHLGRLALLEHARSLVEVQPNASVTRSLPEKDAFLFSLNSLRPEAKEQFNPSVSELLPTFFAGPGFRRWTPCSDKLLDQLSAKLTRRAQAKALKGNCDFVGSPQTAPDALFALDGRLSEAELDQALKALACGPSVPEVVMVRATKDVRGTSSGWRGRIARFCVKLDQAFGARCPGIVVVVDEPYAIGALRDELAEQHRRRERKGEKDARPILLETVGVPFTARSEGLIEPGESEGAVPASREFDVHVVDADIAKVVRRLIRIANDAPGGRDSAQPALAAINYLSRIGALPCGVKDLTDYLSGPEISSATRSAFDWLGHVAALRAFERQGSLPGARGELEGCIADGSKAFERYQGATPFALRLARLVEEQADGAGTIRLVFSSPLNRLLAERFLRRYDGFTGGLAFESLNERVVFTTTAQLAELRDSLRTESVAFVGLNQDALRFVLTDNALPDKSTVLITLRNGQVLRGSLSPIAAKHPEFAAFRPRIEALLSQIANLPEDSSVLSSGDYTLPSFKVELTADVSNGPGEMDPDAWKILLEGGGVLYRRPTHKVYVYDPSSHLSTDRGFRSVEVSSLKLGDKVFVMSGELREMVEQVLRDAGVQIQSDKTFEGALRAYHKQVKEKLESQYPGMTTSDQVRTLRRAMIALNSKLESELPSEHSMRNWVNLGDSPSTPFDQLKPQAPLKEANFNAFATVLGFSGLEASYLWQRVILAIRNSRRIDGRHVSDIYAYMLLQPESAMVHSSITRQTLQLLFERARESVSTVEAVAPVNQEATN